MVAKKGNEGSSSSEFGDSDDYKDECLEEESNADLAR